MARERNSNLLKSLSWCLEYNIDGKCCIFNSYSYLMNVQMNKGILIPLERLFFTVKWI